jgi:hypothetical protein
MKVMAVTSMPCLIMTSIASVLSNPPEYNATAFGIHYPFINSTELNKFYNELNLTCNKTLYRAKFISSL